MYWVILIVSFNIHVLGILIVSLIYMYWVF